MKQKFIIHKGHKALLLLFAGWGADEHLFQHYVPSNMDFMVCYDYRNLDFDTTLISSYHTIHLVGWSMGVWAGATLAPLFDERLGKSIAINGTRYPIDDTKGISVAIFKGTLEGLCDKSLHKFLRRMCMDTDAFRKFLEITPRRPLEELREELSSIMELYPQTETKNIWREAVVSSDDHIIPAEHQCNAWKADNTIYLIQENMAHYEPALFQHYLEDIWINN